MERSQGVSTDPVFASYDRVRGRIGELLTARDAELAVPACPGWSMRELAAHLAGLAEDVVAGRTDRYAEADWTAAQIDRAAGQSVAMILARWEAAVPGLRVAPLPPIGRAFETVARLVLQDAVIHEHDLRGALDAPDPDDETVRWGLGLSVELLGRVLRRPRERGEVPALEVVATGIGTWRFGDGPEWVSVEADAFELWRGLTGRRSWSQVAALRWSGDPSPFQPHWAFGPLTLASQPIRY